MTYVRLAIKVADPRQVVDCLSSSLNIEFQSRESSYLGPYWCDKPRKNIVVLYNEDPVHLPGDPPDEFYFEANFSTHATLVDISGPPDLAARITEILFSHFPDSKAVSQMEY